MKIYFQWILRAIIVQWHLMLDEISHRKGKTKERMKIMNNNKVLVWLWLLEISLFLVVGILLVLDNTWWLLAIGLPQATFVFLFWIFALVLGTTGDPKKRKYFTIIPVGKFCLIKRGGELAFGMINVEGKTIKKTDNDPFEIVDGEDKRGFLDTLSSLIGIRCLSPSFLPLYSLLSRKSQWNDVGRKDPNDKNVELIPREEEIVFFSYQKNYGWLTPEVETGKGSISTLPGGAPIEAERLPIDIKTLTQTRIVRAYRALVLNNWWLVDGATVDQVITRYGGSHTVDEITEKAAAEVEGVIIKENPRLLEIAGVENISAQYGGYGYSGISARELQASSTKRWQKIQEAEGAAALVKLPGMAEVEVLKAKNEALRCRAEILSGAGPEIAGSIAYADNKTVTVYAPGRGNLLISPEKGGGK